MDDNHKQISFQHIVKFQNGISKFQMEWNSEWTRAKVIEIQLQVLMKTQEMNGPSEN